MEPVAFPPRTLGVTGGIGSGKSTVCRMLADLGAVVFHADEVARALMEVDTDVRSEVVDAFGPACYRRNGHLNRAYLGGVVFGSRALIRQLNAIVHPRVGQEFRRMHRHLRAPLLVHEAALIYESGADAHLDMVAVVDAPLEERYNRVHRRDGLSREAICARMQHQMPRCDLLRRADLVVNNSGTLSDLRHEAAVLFKAATCPLPPVA